MPQINPENMKRAAQDLVIKNPQTALQLWNTLTQLMNTRVSKLRGLKLQKIDLIPLQTNDAMTLFISSLGFSVNQILSNHKQAKLFLIATERALKNAIEKNNSPQRFS